MTNWTDPNSIRRRCKILKYYVASQEKIEKEIERIQRKLELIEWTRETLEYRIRLYKKLGEVTEMFNIDRIRIKWYKEYLLEKSNLTG